MAWRVRRFRCGCTRVTLKITYQTTALSEYSVTFDSDHKHIEEVKRSHRIETYFRSPQLHLWQTSETEWLLALRRREPAPRKKPGKIIPLAHQLPLPFDATG
jgi:hypothetical protein